MENDNEPEVIRQRMEETRTALTEKVERLEGQLTSMVGVGAEAVTETIETVKETVAGVTDAVQEKVQTVKNFFDIRLQFKQHPFLVIGGALAVGYVAYRLLRSSGKSGGSSTMGAIGHAVTAAGHAALAAVPAVTALTSGPSESKPEPKSEPKPVPVKTSRPKGESFVGDALGEVRRLAVGSVMGLLRDMATTYLPKEFGQTVAESVNGLTQRLGVEPMASPIDLNGESKPEETQEEPAKAGKPGRGRKAAVSQN